MLENIWHSSNSAAEDIGITEIKLSHLRENGFLNLEYIGKALLWDKKNPGIQRLFTIQYYVKN